MATYRITAPDGNQYDITAPDDADEAQVLEYAKANYKTAGDGMGSDFQRASKAQSREQMTQKPMQAPPSGFVRGFMDDPLNAIKQIGAETETARMLAPEWAKRAQQGIQAEEQAYQAARGNTSDVDWGRLGGQMLNPLNLMVAGLTKTPPGMSLAGRAAMGGIGGATMGALSPVYGQAAREDQAALGALGGVAAAPVAGALSRVMSPKVSPELALLRKEGITPTIGQSFGPIAKRQEDLAMSLPLTGDAIAAARRNQLDQFNVAAFNRALTPIGEKASGRVGFGGMAEVRHKLNNAYNQLLPNLSFKPDQDFINNTTSLRQLVGQLEPSDQGLYDRIIKRVMSQATPQGNMSGVTVKNVESELGKEITKLAKDSSYGKQQVMDALKQYRDELRQGLERANPMFAERLQAINEGWANYAILRRAASGQQAAQTGGFTPAQLMQGVQESAKRSGQAVGRGKLSEGQALMQDLASAAQQVLPSKYPDSGTAGRMYWGGGITGATLGGMPYVMPAGVGLSAAALPYLPGIRKSVDVALNANRGRTVNALADMVRSTPALLAPSVSPLLAGIYGNGNN